MSNSVSVAILKDLNKAFEGVSIVATLRSLDENTPAAEYLADLLDFVNFEAIEGYKNADLDAVTEQIDAIYQSAAEVCGYKLAASKAMELLHATCDKQLWEANDDVLDIYSMLVEEL